MNTKIQILSNTNYPVGEVIKSELLESTKICIAVAFLRKSGLDQISKALDYALTKNNAKVEIIVGLDFKTTDYNALLALEKMKLEYPGFSYYCFGDKKDNFNELVFHPKIYLFSNELFNNAKYTSIMGSSNLTAGGLSSNFEVNVIFREVKPVYFSQLESIYNGIKFTESIFIPSKEYLEKYGYIKNKIDKFGEKLDSPKISKSIEELKKEEAQLPGTVPSLKKILIEIIKKREEEGMVSVPLKIIYEEAEKIVNERKISFKMDTFRNSIRGELNKHEIKSTHPDNISLFIRSPDDKAHYSLSESGQRYKGR